MVKKNKTDTQGIIDRVEAGEILNTAEVKAVIKQLTKTRDQERKRLSRMRDKYRRLKRAIVDVLLAWSYAEGHYGSDCRAFVNARLRSTASGHTILKFIRGLLDEVDSVLAEEGTE